MVTCILILGLEVRGGMGRSVFGRKRSTSRGKVMWKSKAVDFVGEELELKLEDVKDVEDELPVEDVLVEEQNEVERSVSDSVLES